MVDPIVIVDLLLRGPAGWVALAAGGSVSMVVTAIKARRRHAIRLHKPKPVAKQGYGGRYADVSDEEFRKWMHRFHWLEGRFNRIRSDAHGLKGPKARHEAGPIFEQAEKILEDIDRNCTAMSGLNVSFGRKTDSEAFFGTIDEHRAMAEKLRKFIALRK